MEEFEDHRDNFFVEREGILREPITQKRRRQDLSRIVEGEEITSQVMRERVRQFERARANRTRKDFNVAKECCSCLSDEPACLHHVMFRRDKGGIDWVQCSFVDYFGNQCEHWVHVLCEPVIEDDFVCSCCS